MSKQPSDFGVGYRRVRTGEHIWKGDEWFDVCDETWNHMTECLGEELKPGDFIVRRKRKVKL
jgi:hypothetical protein